MQTRQNSIRVLHTNFHLGWGGQAARVFYLCRTLSRMGVDVTVAAPAGSVLVEKCRDAGIRVLDDVRFSKGFRPIDFLHDVLSIRRLLVSKKTDILHTHGSQDTWSGCVAASLLSRRPAIVRTRHNTFPVQYSFVNRVLHRRLLDWLIIVSDSVLTRYDKFLQAGILKRERISTIHSCIQVDRFDPRKLDRASIRAALEMPLEAAVILVAARLAREKGHIYLLKAFASIASEFPEAILLISGEGNQERVLKEATVELGIAERVRFLGFREDVPALLAAADISVLPSIDCDASSASIKEAMAMERPVIATRIGGAAEIIEDGTDGIIVPPGDVAALSDALRGLLREPSLGQALGRAARAKVVVRFTEERLAQETMNVYNRVLEARKEN